MRDRPILFSGPMVRAILDGRKTQTRRVIAPVQPRADGRWPAGRDPVPDCPFGRSGDQLWVRETHALIAHDGFAWVVTSEGNRVLFHADLSQYPETYPDGAALPDPYESNPRWRPSIHMPRWASRLTLEVVSVRVERLQDISNKDIAAEGFEVSRNSASPELAMARWDRGTHSTYSTARAIMAMAWNEIHGDGAWSANPWVWVIEFKRAAMEPQP